MSENLNRAVEATLRGLSLASPGSDLERQILAREMSAYAQLELDAMNAYGDVRKERQAQDIKWGGPRHDDTHNENDWISCVRRHTDKASYDFRKQMIRVAALAVAAVESYDRKARLERRNAAQERTP
jgi:hypothetical protein